MDTKPTVIQAYSSKLGYMRTGLVRHYGEKDTIQEYIDDVVKRFRRSEEVRETALKMFNYIAQNTSFRGLAPSMQAMTLVNLAAKDNFQDIPSKAWNGICSYNTLLKHSKDFKKVLEKADQFSNLKYHKLGR